MASKQSPTTKDIDSLLKSMLVLSRTVESILEGQAVQKAVREPLSASKVQILRLLGRRTGQTASQLARFLGVSNPAVSQIVDAMARDKLLIRKTATQDRREVNLHLTEKGKRWFRAVRNRQRHLVRNAVRMAGAEDIAKWGRSMEEAASALARSDNAFSLFCAQCGAHADESCVLVDGDAQCLFTSLRVKASRRCTSRCATTAEASAKTSARKSTRKKPTAKKKVGAKSR